jgi:hypothetical protein
LKRPRGDSPHGIRQFFVGFDAAERHYVFFGRLFDHVGNVVESDDADQSLLDIDDGSGNKVVALEKARHAFLILIGWQPPAFLDHQVGDRHRPFRAQQPIERHRAKEASGLVDDVEFVELFRQFLGLAHVVDSPTNIPIRRTAINSVCIRRPAENSG